MGLILLSLTGSLLLFAIGRGASARYVALGVSLATLALNAGYLMSFQADGTMQFVTDFPWMPSAGIRFRLGIDGISMLLLLLTNLLTPLIIVTTFSTPRGGSFYALVLLMQAAVNGLFMALDGLLFYVFWEMALLPVYFICAIWGGENRVRITYKFFVYTFLGSLLMLLSLLYVYFRSPGPSFGLEQLYAAALTEREAIMVCAGFFLSFAVKIPIFPFHTWQPDTYTVAPPAGTMLLSGIMLKMGLYGLIRWMIPLAPEAARLYPVFIGLAVAGIVFASLIAIRMDDVKRLLAYSSIAHTGLIAAGLLAFNTTALQGGMIQMFNHGLNAVGLFFVADIIERRLQTRRLGELGGIARRAPLLAALFMIVTLGAVAVPLTNGFAGELLLLKGLYDYNLWAAVAAGSTIILGAVYMLRLYQLSMFGPPGPAPGPFRDVSDSELFVLATIALLVLALGVYPQPVLDLTAASVQKLLLAAAIK